MPLHAYQDRVGWDWCRASILEKIRYIPGNNGMFIFPPIYFVIDLDLKKLFNELGHLP